MKWFGNLFSIDEAKASVLMLSLIVSLGFSLWMYYERGSIEEPLLTIDLGLIGSVAGINIATRLKSKAIEATDVEVPDNKINTFNDNSPMI